MILNAFIDLCSHIKSNKMADTVKCQIKCTHINFHTQKLYMQAYKHTSTYVGTCAEPRHKVPLRALRSWVAPAVGEHEHLLVAVYFQGLLPTRGLLLDEPVLPGVLPDAVFGPWTLWAFIKEYSFLPWLRRHLPTRHEFHNADSFQVVCT